MNGNDYNLATTDNYTVEVTNNTLETIENKDK